MSWEPLLCLGNKSIVVIYRLERETSPTTSHNPIGPPFGFQDDRNYRTGVASAGQAPAGSKVTDPGLGTPQTSSLDPEISAGAE